MKVVFRQNLGLIDAKKYGLDSKKCQIGMEADVSKEAADALCHKDCGVAVDAKEADEDELIVSYREEQAKQEAAKAVKAVAKTAEIHAPAKHDKHDK